MATHKPVPSTITTALIYTRVSSDEQAREGVSLDVQLHECRQYAARQGWVLGPEYQDVMSGTRDDRPQYQALLVEVRRLRETGQRAVVVVLRLDRFGRRVLERVRCREELKALGVPTHTVREGGEVSDLVANILASVAEEEVRQLGERVRIAKQHVIAAGWHPGGRCPWGYAKRGATPIDRAAGAPQQVLIVDETTAPFVREAHERVAHGASVRGVARWIASLPGTARGGRPLGFRAVLRALKAPVYIARRGDADGATPADVLDRPLAQWPALVSDATWLAVQQRIARHQRLPRQGSGRHLLVGFLRCPQCGARMAGMPRWQHRAAMYRCIGQDYGQGAPDATCRVTVAQHLLDGQVRAVIAALTTAALTDAGRRRALKQQWRALAAPADRTTESQRAVYERSVAQAQERLTRAALLLVDGVLDRSGYELACTQAREDLDAAQAQLAALSPRDLVPELPPLDTVLAAMQDWAVALDTADVPTQRDVLAPLVEQVIPQRISRGRYTLTIVWTPLGAALQQPPDQVSAVA